MKIEAYSGARWPFSNVDSAMLQAAGLFYGRTGAHDDLEYSIQNALTGAGSGKARIAQLEEKPMELRGTGDHVFLLSVEELVKHFGDNGDLENRIGWYWGGEKNGGMVLRDGCS